MCLKSQIESQVCNPNLGFIQRNLTWKHPCRFSTATTCDVQMRQWQDCPLLKLSYPQSSLVHIQPEYEMNAMDSSPIYLTTDNKFVRGSSSSLKFYLLFRKQIRSIKISEDKLPLKHCWTLLLGRREGREIMYSMLTFLLKSAVGLEQLIKVACTRK